jgi:hypothetical protein
LDALAWVVVLDEERRRKRVKGNIEVGEEV